MRHWLSGMIPLHRNPVAKACLAGLGLLLPLTARAASPGEALVIGESAYAGLPTLQACALSAHTVAAALRRINFTVEEQEDASSGAVFAAIATLTRRIKASPAAPVFLYVCGYVSAFDDRPFLLPVSAQVARPADLLTQGVLAKSLVDAIKRNTKAPAVIALDAIAMPNAPHSLGLDRLSQDLPDTIGFLAVRDSAPYDRPTPFAALLAPALKGPAVQSARLLADLKPPLSAEQAVQIAALRVPAEHLYLADIPVQPVQPPQPTPVPGPASPAAPTTSQATSTPAAGLPDEARMTDAQRRQVQQALAALGYYDGNIDGIVGPETRAAIRRWQHERHVPMTGELTGAQATQLTGG